MFPPAIAKAMAMPAISRTKSIKDVQHVVILMQENRSFDHYFGTLRGVRGYADPRPDLLPNGKPVFHQPTASIKMPRYQGRNLPAGETEVLPWYINPSVTTEYTAGTDHGWASGHQAWNDGRWDSWVTQKQDVLTMGYLKRQDLQYHFALAEAFTIGDAYHCSVHADTLPNRICLWTGTTDPRNVYGKTKLNGPATDERDGTDGYTWTTYAEQLEQAGVSWKVYQGGSGVAGQPTDNFTDNSLMMFHNFQPDDGADPNSPLVQKGASDHTLVEFADDVKNGTLPQVTWIVPPAMYSEHPSSSPTNGAYYINLVLEALTSDPKVWGSTVLLLDYDENDGLFDHVVPPVPTLHSTPNGEGMVSGSLVASLADEFMDMDNFPWTSPAGTLGPGGLQPIGLGPRVPMIAISPWSRGGYVCSETFDHTSVLRFLEKRFGVRSPYISDWRRSVCGDLTSMFDFECKSNAAPPQFKVPAPISSQGLPYSVGMPQAMPVQETGTRPARPLGYRALVNEGTRSAGALHLTLQNHGRIGAAFHIADRINTSAAPRRYTVAGGDALRDVWNLAPSAGYQLAAYGPNGSYYEFQGQEGDGLLVEFDHQGKDHVRVRIQNLGKGRRTVQLANAYQRGGKAQATRVLRGHDSIEYTWQTGGQGNWYDVRVTALDGASFVRRYAGHLENGEASISDPGPLQK